MAMKRGRGAGKSPFIRGGSVNSPYVRMYSPDIDFKSIGQKLRDERENLGLTQEEVAEVLDITPAFVGHIERAERSMSLKTLIHFCNFYRVTIDYLLADTLPQEDDNTLAQIADMLKDKLPEQQAALLDIIRAVARHI